MRRIDSLFRRHHPRSPRQKTAHRVSDRRSARCREPAPRSRAPRLGIGIVMAASPDHADHDPESRRREREWSAAVVLGLRANPKLSLVRPEIRASVSGASVSTASSPSLNTSEMITAPAPADVADPKVGTRCPEEVAVDGDLTQLTGQRVHRPAFTNPPSAARSIHSNSGFRQPRMSRLACVRLSEQLETAWSTATSTSRFRFASRDRPPALHRRHPPLTGRPRDRA